MKPKINPKLDHNLVTVDNWEIYITQAGFNHYLKHGMRIVLLLGGPHNDIFGHALSSGILQTIRYDNIDGVESFSFTTSESEIVIMTNSIVEPLLSEALQRHSGRIIIMTPSGAHISGEEPFAIDMHSSGKAFEISELK